jgi:membrane protease YdiL (CAAX protease family)
MKNKFIQVLAALVSPISFILILFVITTTNIIPISRYGLGGTIVTTIALFITFVALKIERKTFKYIGLQFERKTPLRFTIGFLVGMLITIVMLTIVIRFSSVTFIYKTDSNIASVLFWLLAFFPLAFMEEVIFRGYAFIKINKSVGLWPAQILLAILFAWYHDFTGQTLFNQLIGPGIWALIYGIAAVWSKGLAFPTGLHMAINVVLALVGQKDNRHAIWNLEYTTEITPILQAQTENTGLIMQISILAIGIILTEYYRKNKT